MTREVKINHKTLLTINSEWVLRKTYAELVGICLALADRCRDLFEKLNKNSQNSSISPSTFIPGHVANDNSAIQDLIEDAKTQKDAPKTRKKRTCDFGRTTQLPITEVIDLFPSACNTCHCHFSAEDHLHSRCFNASSQVDLEISKTALGRLSCWAHLERKAKGISETAWLYGMNFGTFVLKYFKLFKSAIYKARESKNPTESIKLNFTQQIADFKETCGRYVDSPHQSTAALAKEFLYDWESIFRILDYPHFPLTNNLAERALRHWVIIRKITQGTRTAIGRKITAILASIIATCKLRKRNVIDFVQDTVTAARQGTQMPSFEVVRVGQGCELK